MTRGSATQTKPRRGAHLGAVLVCLPVLAVLGCGGHQAAPTPETERLIAAAREPNANWPTRVVGDDHVAASAAAFYQLGSPGARPTTRVLLTYTDRQFAVAVVSLQQHYQSPPQLAVMTRSTQDLADPTPWHSYVTGLNPSTIGFVLTFVRGEAPSDGLTIVLADPAATLAELDGTKIALNDGVGTSHQTAVDPHDRATLSVGGATVGSTAPATVTNYG